MITYAERSCFGRESHLPLFARVVEHVDRVSNRWGNELRCHELTRAIHLTVYETEYKLDVIDGKCGPVEHSWLRFSDGVILDVYAPGRLPAVQLVDPIVGTMYQAGKRRDDIKQMIIDQLVREMRTAPDLANNRKKS